jgi:hypothetical protein
MQTPKPDLSTSEMAAKALEILCKKTTQSLKKKSTLLDKIIKYLFY